MREMRGEKGKERVQEGDEVNRGRERDRLRLGNMKHQMENENGQIN